MQSMSKRALLSVSDKRGITNLARKLVELGYEIVSTGGTAKALKDEKIAVTPIEAVTSFPECFSGRVKTMHPKLMGGILYRRADREHVKQAKELGIEPIDLVIVNLYPFRETLAKAKASGKLDDQQVAQSIVEQIDIGGPTLLRSAAKNWESVTVVCDTADYERVIDQCTDIGNTTPELRKELAAKVFLHTSAYDALIAGHLSGGTLGGISFSDGQTLRYGENPHQQGKFYALYPSKSTEKQWHVLQGKALSYLNILDSDAAWFAVQAFADPTTVMVKHANPSGIASNDSIEEAFQRAYDADRLSAFGVIIALNRPCSSAIAQNIIDQKIFTEVLLAPSFEAQALELLKQKPNIRVVECSLASSPSRLLYRTALDGILVQNDDVKEVAATDLTVATKRKPTASQIVDLLFAWKVVKIAKSNAIVLVKDRTTVGIGAGQTSRVDASWIAAKRAGERAMGAVLASDAFFPFPDALQEAAKHGISAVIQPGGSVRDTEVIAEADRLGIAMVLTGVRAFRH